MLKLFEISDDDDVRNSPQIFYKDRRPHHKKIFSPFPLDFSFLFTFN